MLALLAAPATWAAETLGHATNGTFPTGGPASAALGGPGGGGRGPWRPGGCGAALAADRAAPAAWSRTGGFGAQADRPPAAGGRSPGTTGGFAGPAGIAGGLGGRPGALAGGGMFGGDSTTLTAAINYAKAHGGGTIGVSSQSSAAAAILSSNAERRRARRLLRARELGQRDVARLGGPLRAPALGARRRRHGRAAAR